MTVPVQQSPRSGPAEAPADRRRFDRPDLAILLVLSLVPPAFLAPSLLAGDLSYGDPIYHQLPLWEFAARQLAQFQLPFWNPHIYSGYPQAASSSTALFYPTTLLLVFLPTAAAVVISQILPLSLAGVAMYLLLRDETLTRSSTFIGGLAVSLSAGFNAQLSHYYSTATVAWFPLQLLLVNRLVREGRLRDVWLLAGVGLLQILAGFPQLLVYSFLLTAAYAVVRSLSTRGVRAARRPVLFVATALAAALGLAAFALVPTLELVAHSARTAVSYENFSSGSYPPLFGLTFFFPWLFGGGRAPFDQAFWGLHDYWWEGIQYLGVLAIPLIVLALGRLRRDRRIAAYAVLAGLTVVLALGRYTFVHQLLFALPLYQSFRIPSRYLLLLGPILGILLAFGFEAVRERRLGPGRLALGALIGFAAYLAGALLLAVLAAPAELGRWWDGLVSAGWRAIAPATLPWLLVLAAGLGLLALAARTSRPVASRLALAGVALLIVIDLAGFAWLFHGIWPREEVAEAVAACVEPAPPNGDLDRVDRVGFAEFLLAPSTGPCSPNYVILTGENTPNGYDNLPPRRQLELLNSGGYGQSLRLETVARHAPLLDVQGVRYLVAHARSPTVTRVPGVGPRGDTLDLQLQPGDSIRLSFAEPVPANRLDLVSMLHNAVSLEQGTTVAELTFQTKDGRSIRVPLRAGIEASEWAWDRPELAGQVRHERAPVAFSFPADGGTYQGHAYQAQVHWGETAEISGLDLRFLSEQAAVTFRTIALASDRGNAPVQVGVGDILRGSPDYRIVSDQDNLLVVENPAALPRAWFVESVQIVAPEATQAALLSGDLPGGRRFDPRREVLIEASDANHLGADADFNPAKAVRVTGFTAGRIDLAVSGSGRGFVVVNESHYPGWRARLDGAETALLRVNYTQMGLVVPPGEHTLTFWYDARVYLVGLAVSLATALAGVTLSWWALRRPALRW